jgi:hypothetical protein
MRNRSNIQRYYLIIGDTLTLAIVTVIGFASHGTAGTAGSRMLTTFIPLLVAWLLVAPHLKVYDPEIALDVRQLWRPFWAMVLAGPMAAWLRGVLLNSPILPFFVVILGGVSALAILAWRGLYWLLMTRMKRFNG